MVHQESVSATYGSGLSSACVVDVGDQKTSLCCVEDGVSHRSSRCVCVCMCSVVTPVVCVECLLFMMIFMMYLI